MIVINVLISLIVSLIEGGNAEAAQDMAHFGNRVEVGLAFAAEQAQFGIVYSQLSAEQQEALLRIGREVLARVMADEAILEAAIAGIPGRLATLVR